MQLNQLEQKKMIQVSPTVKPDLKNTSTNAKGVKELNYSLKQFKLNVIVEWH